MNVEHFIRQHFRELGIEMWNSYILITAISEGYGKYESKEFAIWVSMNEWNYFESAEVWIQKDKLQTELSTEQLYELFKSHEHPELLKQVKP